MSPDLELAHRLADAADTVSRRYWDAKNFETEIKPDGSPVTAADREVEETMLALIRRYRPDDAVLGEEVGPSGEGPRRWILDGIDGTHNFVAERTEWGTHIALEVQGEVTVGVVTSPALQRRWWAARGEGTWTAEVHRDGRREVPTALSCSTTDSLDAATVSAIPAVERVKGWKAVVGGAIARGEVHPSAFGHSAIGVASGAVDATVHLYGGEWDHAVGVVIVEEAGGTFSDLLGGRSLDTGTALFTNGPLGPQLRTAVAAALPTGAGRS